MATVTNKLREALEAINRINTGGLKRLLVELVEADIFDGGLINKTISAVEEARRALSAPPRQCDMGTAEAQEQRFYAFCDTHRNCSGCPHIGIEECALAWAQMPYVEKEGGNNAD